MTDARRNSELAKIHIGAKALGWDDATYRAVLERFSAGKRSAKDLDARERGLVLTYMREQGFEPEAARKPHKLSADPVAEIRRGMQRRDDEALHHAFIRAMWIWLGEHGELRRGDDEAALDRFVARQTGVAVLKWLPPDKSASVAEALKKWVYRVAKRSSRGNAA